MIVRVMYRSGAATPVIVHVTQSRDPATRNLATRPTQSSPPTRQIGEVGIHGSLRVDHSIHNAGRIHHPRL